MVGNALADARGEIHPYIFRHTYCAARLQTLDGGAPVSAYTVGKEMGQGGDALSGACMVILARCGIGAQPWSSAWSSIAFPYGSISAACIGAGCHSSGNRQTSS